MLAEPTRSHKTSHRDNQAGVRKVRCAYLANHVGRVPSCLQVISHSLELQRQPTVLPCAPERVLHSRVECVPATHDSAAARRTDHMPVVAAQLYALLVQGVQERSLDF